MNRNLNLFQPPDPATQNRWMNYHGSSLAIGLTCEYRLRPRPMLVVAPTLDAARTLRNDLLACHDDLNTHNCLLFDDWETLPFERLSPHQGITSSRLHVLHTLLQAQPCIVLASITTLMHRLMPKQAFRDNVFLFNVGDALDLKTLEKNCLAQGYHRVETVQEHGEFARRGSILDLFPMGSPHALRLDCFDGAIDGIRIIDTETQRASQPQSHVHLMPAHEYLLDASSIRRFRETWRTRFAADPREAPLYQNISDGQACAGAEYYLPLFYEELANITDYLPENSLIVRLAHTHDHAETFWQQCIHRHEQYAHDITHPLCDVDACFIPPDALAQAFKHHASIQCLPLDTDPTAAASKKAFHFPVRVLPPLHAPNDAFKNMLEALPEGVRLCLCADTAGRMAIIKEKAHDAGITLHEAANLAEALRHPTHSISITPFSQGFILPEQATWVLTEADLYPQHTPLWAQNKNAPTLNPDLIFKDLSELNLNDAVVHIEHGVGRYLGLITLDRAGQQAEFLHLAYAGQDKIYIPITALHLIHRYTGSDPEHAPLHKLGSDRWSKEKSKALKKIQDVAAQLLDTYSKRAVAKGFACAPLDDDFKRFREAFPFEETHDQQQAIDATLNGMMQAQCMDRLICGDVGFGKTEVAMQAAFLAVQNNKQVAILVPTTLLCEQHLKSFEERFAAWPVRIASLSRFSNSKKTQETLDAMASGRVDIVIGTHKLLNPQHRFKNLGLLVVDEEHRFGIKQKERIKALKAEIDILTLTATPIPRTLNLALHDLRDLSLITTPPAKRLAVKTTVSEWSDARIHEAIEREMMRGGQAYVLHNDVQSIAALTERLQKQMPHVRFQYAHGQMPERTLERIMFDFYHQRFHVLICTTIIESGIDVPTANTIIINRADKLGLAALHQLRGRVGRSHHQAYAYLITPPRKSLSGTAKKRMDAMTQLNDLGAGFMLANHDLEIRGAGELLGEEQSGHMQHIGFSLYMELLNEAVAALKAGDRLPVELTPSMQGCHIELPVSALLPEDYVGDAGMRLTQYKRLSRCKNDDAIDALQAEWIDRFGPLPAATHNLIALARLQKTGEAMGVEHIQANMKQAVLRFNAKPHVAFERIIQLIQSQPKRYQLVANNQLRTVWDADFSKEIAPHASEPHRAPHPVLNALKNTLQALSS